MGKGFNRKKETKLDKQKDSRKNEKKEIYSVES